MIKSFTVKEWKFLLEHFLRVIKSSENKKAKRKLKETMECYPDEKVNRELAAELNEILTMLDADTRDRFLRVRRDMDYESGRARVSVSCQTKEKLDALLKKTGLKNHDALILHLLRNQQK